MQLIFYTVQNTPRVDYIVSTLLKAIGLKSFQITTDKTYYLNFNGPKVNYSAENLSKTELHVVPVALLFEREIHQQEIECFSWNNHTVFFKTAGDLPFDIFAASFYLLCRYEEYLPHHLDEYGRYGHTNSIAFKENFLHLPLINLWLTKFRDLILSKFPQLNLEPPAFRFIPSYDIDIAWNYLNKGLIRNVGGGIKSLLKGNLQALNERLKVLVFRYSDPFDIYQHLDKLHKQCNLSPYYFFLLAKRNKGYDKNISPTNRKFRKLIREISRLSNTGIHPSWQTGDNTLLLTDEILTLKQITEQEVVNSRQHYIRVTLPETYRNLLNNGITSDFSMGYGSINGFRASYCLPFYWYDLHKEAQTPLLIYPFCFMEANSYYEQHYTLAEAESELKQYAEITKHVGGVLITIFHNHTLGNKQLFKNWLKTYESFCINVSRGF